MDKYYIAINSELASSLMTACKTLGRDFEKEIHGSLEAGLFWMNEEIHEQKQKEEQRKQKYNCQSS